ncbi:MAG: hypothetical protein KDB21_13235 [Acidimicrobiales bacterium]|nr:hypothetical protein [Acidimicrobiales bacterium]
MRMTRRQTRHMSRGAAAVMVSFSLLALFGASALAIDLGNAWQNERHLNTTSDSAALGAAARYAIHESGCGSTATNLVAANDADAALVECNPGGGAGTTSATGWVEVTTTKEVDYLFGPIIGVASQELTSTTIVRYGIPSRVRGLRPFALCVDTLDAIPAFQTWLAAGATTESPPITIPYGKDDNPEACNDGLDVPGNWALLDFDGGANQNSDTQEWVLNGYQGMIGTGDYEGDTGSFSQSLQQELASLKSSGEEFGLPLFGSASDNGSNASFEIVAFANVRLENYKVSGSASNRSLTLVFLPGVLDGECCDDAGLDYGAAALQICAVDPDDLTDC